MSEVDELPYNEHDKFALGYRKAARWIRCTSGNAGNKHNNNCSVEQVAERSADRRNPPITLPRLKGE